METLYQLTDEWMRLIELADDPDTDPEVFKDTLEGLECAIEVKCDNYCAVIRNLEVVVGGLDGQIKSIEKILDGVKKHKKSVENYIEGMKTDLCDSMIKTGKPKLQTERFSMWTQKTPPAVVIDDETKVGMDYYKVPEPKIDRTKILEDLKKGAKLDWAHLEQHDIVRIK